MTPLSSSAIHQAELLEKLRSRQALIGIVGLGYVGLPLSLTYAEVGYQVLGLDIDQVKADSINQGESYIEHIGTERVSRARQEQRFEATVDFCRAVEADALILCVPTPLNQYREPIEFCSCHNGGASPLPTARSDFESGEHYLPGHYGRGTTPINRGAWVYGGGRRVFGVFTGEGGSR